MFVTVLICTRDRAASLRGTLESICIPTNLKDPEWELIVVYGPTGLGETAVVCQEFEQRFPTHFRSFIEEKLGKSHALNRGITESRGDLIAMTDDDVRCGPNYIQAIRTSFRERGVDGAQGRILLDCEGGQPAWMGEELSAFMSLRDYGDESFEWRDNLTGTNMVVRTNVIQRIGGFSPEIGASAAGFMEDSEFSIRMREAGCRLIYAPQIIVWHQLPRERLSRRFFTERYFRWGRSEAYLSPLPAPLWRFGLHVAKQVVLKEVRSVFHRISGHPAKSLMLRCEARHKFGIFWQHWLFHKGLQQRSLSRDWQLKTCPRGVEHVSRQGEIAVSSRVSKERVGK